MKKFNVEITFEDGTKQTKYAESNSNITAMNMAINLLEEEKKSLVANVELTQVEEGKKMTDAEYLAKAEAVFKEKQQREISRIADKLKEDDEKAELKKIQDKCPHEKTESYNHRYHTYCRDCGKELD